MYFRNRIVEKDRRMEHSETKVRKLREYYKKELVPTAKKAYRGKIVPVSEIMGGSFKVSRDISMNMIGQIRAEGYIDTMFRIAMVKSGQMSMDDFQGAEGYMKAMEMRQKLMGKAGSAFVNVAHTFKPSKQVSSWSTEFGHAMNFAFSDDMSYSRKRYDPKYVAVIIEIPVDENFVMNNKFMNMLGREAGHSYGEDEMIRISKKPAKGRVHFLHGSRKIAEMLKK